MDLWRVEHVESRRVALDFSPPRQGRTTQLVAESKILANAVELTTWAPDLVQVEVCSECGVERCAPNGWVAPRRSGERVLWLPAFDMLAKHDDEKFGPPHYFAERGVPMFEPTALQSLRAVVPAWTDPETMRPLTTHDVVLLLQWMAPEQLLGGTFNTPRLRREDVLAVSSGERREVIEVLDELLASGLDEQREVLLVEPEGGTELVSLYLDLPGHPDWAPVGRVGDRLELALGGLVVTPLGDL